MKITILEIRKILQDILLKQGLSQKDALFIAKDYLIAELRGKKTHGIVKFHKELSYYKDRKGNPKIIADKGSMVLVDANKEIGQLAARFCIDLLKKRARRYGVAIVGMKNTQRYGTLSTWAKMLADSGLIGMVINSSEPAAVPYGGLSPVLGTNPIAIAIPTLSRRHILIDMATSRASMGSLQYSSIYNKPLPKKTFLDKNGKYTINPNRVKAVEIFGGYKGYGLSLAFEILSGSLLSAKMGKSIKSQYDVGYFFQAIDPTIFQKNLDFKKQNELLLRDIKSSKSKKDFKIYIPGEKSEKLKDSTIKKRKIEISRSLYEKLLRENNYVR